MATIVERSPGTAPQFGNAPTQSAPTKAPAKRSRLDYLDALKVALTALVIAHHVGQAYGPTAACGPCRTPSKRPSWAASEVLSRRVEIGLPPAQIRGLG
jgi:hypothetical protein